MKLEGTLDAFSLPDIFQLLSFTKKTGTLHLRREADSAEQHGLVHLREGSVTGGRSDAACQALGRRLVGAGLVDDEVLADAAEMVLGEPGSGLGKALVASGKVDEARAREVAAEQVTDAVFELLRWENGAFAFVMDEADPDDLGVSLTVEEIVAEGRRRIELWSELQVPSSSAVVTLAAAPEGNLVLSREEWALLSLVDGARTVGDLVSLSGTGEYAVGSVLAGLVQRGLAAVGTDPAGGVLARRQQLLAALEGRPVAARHAEPAAPPAPKAEPVVETVADPVAEPVVEAPALPVQEQRPAVIPERPEPFTPERRPEYAEEPMTALSRLASATQAAAAPVAQPAAVSSHTPSAPAASVGAVHGAHALQPDSAPAPSPAIDRDPSVNKSLLLRLIAGVRGL